MAAGPHYFVRDGAFTASAYKSAGPTEKEKWSRGTPGLPAGRSAAAKYRPPETGAAWSGGGRHRSYRFDSAPADRRSRKVAGDASREQIIAANIAPCSFYRPWEAAAASRPGPERYVAMAWESGCRPAVILSKADLSADPDADLLNAQAAAPGIDIALCSVLGEQTNPGAWAQRR